MASPMPARTIIPPWVPLLISLATFAFVVINFVWTLQTRRAEAILTFQAALHETSAALRKLRKRHNSLNIEPKLYEAGKHPAVLLFCSPDRRAEMLAAVEVYMAKLCLYSRSSIWHLIISFIVASAVQELGTKWDSIYIFLDSWQFNFSWHADQKLWISLAREYVTQVESYDIFMYYRDNHSTGMRYRTQTHGEGFRYRRY
jgi:hypothetical protein